MARKAVVKEAVIEAELRRRVAALGGLCLKITSPGRRGIFDRLLVLPSGRLLCVELKRPKGSRLSPHQRQYVDKFQTLSVPIYIVKTIEDIDALLKS